MEVKVVVSFDERTASLLDNLITALNSRKVQEIQPTIALKEEDTPVVKESNKPALKTPSEPIKTETKVKPATLEDIRSIARKLADVGRQEEYRVILKKYGYTKVNNIEEADYQDIYEEMSALVQGE